MYGKMLVAALLLFTWSAYSQDYARLYADNGNTCQYRDTILKPPLKLKWRSFTEGCFKGSPVIFNGRLFAADRQGQLYCLDAETGELLWKKYYLTYSFSQNDITPAAFGDNLYYFETGPTGSDQAGYLRCIRQDNGNPVWTASVTIGRHGNHPHFSPLIYNGRIYMSGLKDSTVHYFCFNLSDGRLQWDKTFCPAKGLGGNLALCTLGIKPFLVGSWQLSSGSTPGKTVAITADSGRVLWETSIFCTPFSLSIIDSLLYMRSWGGPTTGFLVAARVLTGDTVWVHSINKPAYPYAPAVDRLYVYTRGYGSAFSFHNRRTGVEIGTCNWSGISIPAGGQVLSGCGNMILNNGYGFCGFGHGGITDAGYTPPGGSPRSGRAQGIYAFEVPESPAVTNLKVVWYYKMASNMCTTPAVYQGKLYVTTNNEGAIYCFENR